MPSTIQDASQFLSLGDHLSAERVCLDILSQDDRNADALDFLGQIYNTTGHLDAACRHFEEAVAAAPDAPRYRNNFGLALILAGRLEEAEAQLRAAVNMAPHMSAAWLNLSWVAKATPQEPMVDALKSVLEEPAIIGRTRAVFLFALGKFYDDLGEYDHAWESYVEANQLYGAFYDHGAQLQFAEQSKAVFSPEMMRERTSWGDPSDAPVFIVGMPRCGSTVLERMFDTHSMAAGLGERNEIHISAQALSRIDPEQRAFPQAALGPSNDAYADLGRRWLAFHRQQNPDAARLVDKALHNFVYAGAIRLMFPNATIIDARRNPLDTCLSGYFHCFSDGNEFAFDLGDLGKRYRLYHDLMSHWGNVMDAPPAMSAYEDMIADPQAHMRRILETVGLPYEPVHETAHENPKGILTSSAVQARLPIYDGALERWRHYEKHLGPLTDALGDVL